MRIDVHAHYWTGDYLDLLTDLGQAGAVAARGHVPALRCAIDSFGADRLLLGTDFPYENGDIFIRAVDYINDPQIDPGAARAILDHNATALLGTG